VTGSTLDFVPAPAPGVESCELDGERLVWHGATLHRLDAVGALVWECFDGMTTVGDIGRMLAEGFGATERDVQRDVSVLCAELFDEGLLEGGCLDTPEPRPVIRPGQPPSIPLDSDHELPYATGRFLALHHDFAIRTDDARLATYFDRSLRSFAAPGSSARWYSVVTGAEGKERYRIYLDGEGLLAAPDADVVARYLLWHVNYEVITTSSAHLLVHAAGATIGRQAVVLPGEMNAGKTTLVAGLVLDGFQFLTDELVALNVSTGLIDPYPRPLNIGRGSWEALSPLRPDDRDEDDPLPRLVWHVDPKSIRPDAVARAAPLRWVIAPRYEQGSPTRLEPLSRPEAVELLHRHAFNRQELGRTGVRALVNAVSRARCARLVSGDLAGAVASVRRFLDDPE
jgi:hypothetical protein